MKKQILSLIAGLSIAAGVQAQSITGAGATFPYPLYGKWAEMYQKETGISLNYQSIGSSGGIRQIRAKTVTFGATDAPLKGEELDKDGMIQFPTVLGGIVPIVNLDGFKPGEIRVSGEVLAELFLGSIVKWNDPKIAQLNPGIALPNVPVIVVHRADGSGTTFIFTDYLNEVSQAWSAKVGKGATVKWPASASVGGKGNEGVAAYVSRVKGAIGYVEYAYAKKNSIVHLAMINKDKETLQPSDDTFAAAATRADWFSVPGMGISLVNQQGKNSWPIVGATYILMYKEPQDRKATQEVIKFFDYAFRSGAGAAADLDYVPLPKSLQDGIRSKVWTQIK